MHQLSCLLLYSPACAAGTVTCKTNVANTGNWRLENLSFSNGNSGADVSGCSTAIVLQPGNSHLCDAVVSITQPDFDSATATTALKSVHVDVEAALTGKDKKVQGSAVGNIPLSITPGVKVEVVATPTTIKPTLGENTAVSALLNVTLTLDCIADVTKIWVACMCGDSGGVLRKQWQQRIAALTSQVP